ncbi:MAG: tripartite tricarboxylate transporter substrate binding protein [Burkholderiales bacterium]
MMPVPQVGFAVLAFVVGIFSVISADACAAEEFPNKPIRIIVPFPAGSSADTRTRRLVPFLTQRLKQPIIIDNRPGAAGSIGTGLAVKSPPDGYTITYIVTTTVAVGPHVYKEVGIDSRRDLIPLIVAMKTASFLTVKADSPFQSARELIAYAKANPGKLTYGTSGPGSPQHLMGERLKQLAGIQIVAIPYKGDAPTLADLMGGQIDMTFGPPPATLPLIESGKLRALAVTSYKRLPRLSNTPTIAESGVPNYDEVMWYGYAAPAGTPGTVVKILHEALRAAMLTLDFRKFAELNGGELVASTQEYATQLLNADYQRYGKIVKDLDITAE